MEEYSELRYLRHKPGISVRLMDLDRAISKLGPKEYQAILLVGLIGIAHRTAGELLGTSDSTIYKRYRHGLESLARQLNQG